MKLIDAKQLTEKERHKLAVAAQKSRPSMKRRAEFRVLMHRVVSCAPSMAKVLVRR
jgi:hypothetical protein